MTQIKYIRKAQKFQREAHEILSIHESAPSRTVILDRTYKRLSGLSLQQDELLRQSLRCIENDLFRASHILAWTALIDFIQHKLGEDNYILVNHAYPKWGVKNLEDFRDKVSEYQVIKTCNKIGLISNSEERVIHGMLGKRNQCAHPSNFFPDYNQTLGFLSDVLDQITRFKGKNLSKP